MNKETKQALEWFKINIPNFIGHNVSSPETLRRFDSMDDKFDSLENIIKIGFDGVHTRQDRTNGNVLRNKEWIAENKEIVKDIKDERKFIKNKFLGKGIDIFFKVFPAGALIYYIITN